MENQDFNTLHTKIQRFFQEGDYTTALALINDHADEFPEYQHLMDYWKITLNAQCGDTITCLELLRDKLESGFWYGEDLLRKNPALGSLQGEDSFEELYKLNQKIHLKDAENTYPMLTLRTEGRCQSGDTPCPLLIGLHENASMASDSMPFWQPAAKTGWLVAVVQSSQALWKGAYVWDDRHQAEQRIIEQYNALKDGYAIDPHRVILGGLSLGGDIAIWLTLERKIPACGFIAIAPDGPCIDSDLECCSLVEKNTENPPRGLIIVGAEDNTIHLDRIQHFTSYLNRSGIECKLHIVANAGHDFNLAYEDSLLEGLAYLLE